MNVNSSKSKQREILIREIAVEREKATKDAADRVDSGDKRIIQNREMGFDAMSDIEQSNLRHMIAIGQKFKITPGDLAQWFRANPSVKYEISRLGSLSPANIKDRNLRKHVADFIGKYGETQYRKLGGGGR